MAPQGEIGVGPFDWTIYVGGAWLPANVGFSGWVGSASRPFILRLAQLLRSGREGGRRIAGRTYTCKNSYFNFSGFSWPTCSRQPPDDFGRKHMR